jgi:hypothetical protein
MSGQADDQRERRTSERVDTGGKLPSQLALDLDTSVVQISAVGMMVELPMLLALGSKHRFTLLLGNKELAVSGMVRNCHLVSASGVSPPVYHVGVEFCDLDENLAQILQALVDTKLESR